jgi:rhodanese-related sulfurtransferase
MKESPSTFLAGLAVILLASLASAGLHAWRSDRSLADALAVSPVEAMAVEAAVPLVSLAEMQMAVEQGTHLVLDARALQEYDQGHIPGAFSLPHADFEVAMQNLAGMLGPADPLIVYCSSATCDDALLVAKRLREAGFAEVSLFLAGWEGWSE